MRAAVYHAPIMATDTQNGHHAVSVTDLFKSFADRKERVHAVDGISFQIEEGEFYTLLGPSGCGKTTTLRCIAGLERTDGGQIIIDGRIVSSHSPNVFVPPHKRDIGMVFQSYAIWPHMTVFENVAFPLRVSKQRVSRSEISRRVEEALSLVELGGYGGRSAWRWPGRWCASPNCCSWMSRCPTWTPSCGSTCGPSCGTSSGGWA